MLIQGFFLMLLVMTFNYPIMIMLCGGLSVGKFMFSYIQTPMLPNEYKQVAGSGAYLPVADNCCNKTESYESNDPISS